MQLEQRQKNQIPPRASADAGQKKAISMAITILLGMGVGDASCADAPAYPSIPAAPRTSAELLTMLSASELVNLNKNIAQTDAIVVGTSRFHTGEAGVADMRAMASLIDTQAQSAQSTVTSDYIKAALWNPITTSALAPQLQIKLNAIVAAKKADLDTANKALAAASPANAEALRQAVYNIQQDIRRLSTVDALAALIKDVPEEFTDLQKTALKTLQNQLATAASEATKAAKISDFLDRKTVWVPEAIFSPLQAKLNELVAAKKVELDQAKKAEAAASPANAAKLHLAVVNTRYAIDHLSTVDALAALVKDIPKELTAAQKTALAALQNQVTTVANEALSIVKISNMLNGETTWLTSGLTASIASREAAEAMIATANMRAASDAVLRKTNDNDAAKNVLDSANTSVQIAQDTLGAKGAAVATAVEKITTATAARQLAADNYAAAQTSLARLQAAPVLDKTAVAQATQLMTQKKSAMDAAAKVESSAIAAAKTATDAVTQAEQILSMAAKQLSTARTTQTTTQSVLDAAVTAQASVNLANQSVLDKASAMAFDAANAKEANDLQAKVATAVAKRAPQVASLSAKVDGAQKKVEDATKQSSDAETTVQDANNAMQKARSDFDAASTASDKLAKQAVVDQKMLAWSNAINTARTKKNALNLVKSQLDSAKASLTDAQRMTLSDILSAGASAVGGISTYMDAVLNGHSNWTALANLPYVRGSQFQGTGVRVALAGSGIDETLSAPGKFYVPADTSAHVKNNPGTYSAGYDARWNGTPNANNDEGYYPNGPNVASIVGKDVAPGSQLYQAQIYDGWSTTSTLVSRGIQRIADINMQWIDAQQRSATASGTADLSTSLPMPIMNLQFMSRWNLDQVDVTPGPGMFDQKGFLPPVVTPKKDSGEIRNALMNAVKSGALIVVPGGFDEHQRYVTSYDPSNGRALPITTAKTGDCGKTNCELWPALYAKEDWANNQIIVAGGQPTAGDVKYHFVMAPSDRITSKIQGSTPAAAIVAGQAALIKGAWPFLKADQIADIIFKTATHLGLGTDVTPDDQYGWGMINIGKSLQPIGALTSQSHVQSASFGVAGTWTFGSGTSGAAAGSPSINFMGVDDYQRGFSTSLAPKADSLASMPLDTGLLFNSVDMQDRLVERTSGTARLAYSFNANGGARFAAASYRNAFAGGELGFGIGNMSSRLFGLSSTPAESFLGKVPLSFSGVDRFSAPYFGLIKDAMHFGLGTRLGGVSLRAGLMRESRSMSEQVSPMPFNGDPQASHHANRSMAIAEIEKTFAGGRAVAVGTLGAMREASSMLGSMSAGSLALNAVPKTAFTSLSAAYAVSPQLSLSGMAAFGYTRSGPSMGSFVTAVAGVKSVSWSLGVSTENCLAKNDRLGLIVAMPNKIVSGALALSGAVSQNEDGSLNYAPMRLNLRPSGTEMDTELAYSKPLAKVGTLTYVAMYRLHPGQDAAAGPDAALGARFNMPF